MLNLTFFKEVTVNTTYDNSLGECLLDNDCLSGILPLINCLLGVCSQTAGMIINIF